MRLSRKGPTYQAADTEARVMRAHGLPTRYWEVEAKDGSVLAGRAVGITVSLPWVAGGAVRQITSTKQRELVRELFEDPAGLRRSYVLAVASEPTDELAMGLAAAVMRRAREVRLRPLCLPVRRGPDDVSITSDPDVVVLHNLPHDCHAMRAQICRDWLGWFDDTFRVVVVGGADPYWFAHKRLSYPVDGAVYLRGELRENLQH